MVTPDRGLVRAMGLPQAVATNIIAMVGVGPFLTIPFMVAAMNGPHILYAWLFGAALALCDGLVYAELASALPGSGGPYVYLREAYRPFGLGRLMSFVFIFQVMLVAPLSIAGGAVGFAEYLGFFWTSMPPALHDVIAAAVCVAIGALLYRPTASIGRLSVVMLGGVAITVGWVIVAGAFSFSWDRAFDFPPEAFRLDARLFAAIGSGGLLAMYNYGGYNTICSVGDEIKTPERTMPQAIVLSIIVVVLLYVVMSTVILGMVPWREAAQSRTIASLFIARTFSDPALGRAAGQLMTALILFVTASSLYALVLGYSRVPFAAARDGQFFRVFARLHPTKHFPHVSLIAVTAASIPFCFFSLGQLVNWVMLVGISTQFVWQCAGVILLRRYRRDIAKPFRMWLYPVPALVSLTLWLYVFATADRAGQLFALAFLASAVAAYAVFQKRKRPPLE